MNQAAKNEIETRVGNLLLQMVCDMKDRAHDLIHNSPGLDGYCSTNQYIPELIVSALTANEADKSYLIDREVFDPEINDLVEWIDDSD